jgi:hypothetical protein
MKRVKFLSRNFILIILFFCFSIPLSAQIKTVGEFFAGGVSDAGLLFDAYITPWANAIGTSLCGGWYNTAKPHKLGGFDITFTTNISFIPEDAKSFDLAVLGLSDNVQLPSGNTLAPSVAGESTSGPELTYLINGQYEVASLRTPQGTGVGLMATPMVQIGVGLIKDTEVNFRFLPNVNLLDFGKLRLWGIGGKHSIKQWIPALKKLPVLNLSLMGGYTSFSSSFNLSVDPEDINNTEGFDQTTEAISFADQTLDLTVKSFTINLLVSANLPVVCFYGGLGIANTKTELGLKGYYPIPTIELPLTTPVVTDESAIKDPVSLEIKNNDGKPTKPRINIGMRLKLGPVTIHGDYTYANYSNVTAGLGISIR